MLKGQLYRMFVLWALGVTFSSCDSTRIYEEYHSFDAHEWAQDDQVRFEYETDSIYAKAINFSVNLRFDPAYAYRNLFTFLKIEMPNGQQINDTLNLLLMDDQGHYLSHVSGGSVKESRHYYKFAVTNPPKGKYIINLQQAMREASLEHVVAVGARIEKIK